MNTTFFLAQLWGPAILAVGIGYLVNPSFYKKIYSNIAAEPLTILVFGMTAIVAGIAQIQAHNVWANFFEGLVSFLGWALLVKGFVFVIAPNFVDRAGIWEMKKKLVPLAGVICIIVGLYLSWIGYFS
jgi:hypothetical protein